MTWFKVDDTLHGHPKARRSGAAAMGIWVLAGSYCGAYNTAGFVPDWWVREWGRTGTTAARKLVDIGLWDEAEQDGEPGYQFHDWNDYQPLSEQVERSREAWRSKKARQRERSSLHSVGDHSMCNQAYCHALRKAQVSPGDIGGHVPGDIGGTKEVDKKGTQGRPSPLSRPDPSRPVPYLPKGKYEDGEGDAKQADSGTGPERADPSPAPHPTYSRDQINNSPKSWQLEHLWDYDPDQPQFGGFRDGQWIECITVPPAHRRPRGESA